VALPHGSPLDGFALLATALPLRATPARHTALLRPPGPLATPRWASAARRIVGKSKQQPSQESTEISSVARSGRCPLEC